MLSFHPSQIVHRLKGVKQVQRQRFAVLYMIRQYHSLDVVAYMFATSVEWFRASIDYISLRRAAASIARSLSSTIVLSLNNPIHRSATSLCLGMSGGVCWYCMHS